MRQMDGWLDGGQNGCMTGMHRRIGQVEAEGRMG